MNDIINIFVIYHKPYVFLESDIFTPIATKDIGLNIISTDTGENIAKDNKILAEFTSFYWVLKNIKPSKYIGFFHYRRYISMKKNLNLLEITGDFSKDFSWSSIEAERIFKDYDMVLPRRMYFDKSIYEQYSMYHEEFYLEEALGYIKKNYPVEYIEAFKKALNKNYGYFCNIFITSYEIFKEYMDFILNIFNYLKSSLKEKYQEKAFAYLGERLFNGYLQYLIDNKALRICEMPRLYIEEDELDYMVIISHDK